MPVQWRCRRVVGPGCGTDAGRSAAVGDGPGRRLRVRVVCVVRSGRRGRPRPARRRSVGAGVAERDLDHDEEPERRDGGAAIQPMGERSASTTCAASDSVTAQASTVEGNATDWCARLRRRISSPDATPSAPARPRRPRRASRPARVRAAWHRRRHRNLAHRITALRRGDHPVTIAPTRPATPGRRSSELSLTGSTPPRAIPFGGRLGAARGRICTRSMAPVLLSRDGSPGWRLMLFTPCTGRTRGR